ncbi:MAG: hypothetical protein H3C31_10750 [Brumimicrobium sp.]|nr:hypothetical protein [Brumimicrobium sp.]
MKKIILNSLLIVATVFIVSSCKKDYTCTCAVQGVAVQGASTTIKNSTKKNAQSACDEYGDTHVSVNGGNVSIGSGGSNVNVDENGNVSIQNVSCSID